MERLTVNDIMQVLTGPRFNYSLHGAKVELKHFVNRHGVHDTYPTIAFYKFILGH